MKKRRVTDKSIIIDVLLVRDSSHMNLKVMYHCI